MTVKPEFDRSKWKIVSVDSFQPDEGLPEHAIDGDPNTFWHTQWSPDKPLPHEMVIDFGEQLKVAAVVYQGARTWITAGSGDTKYIWPMTRRTGAVRRPGAGSKTTPASR